MSSTIKYFAGVIYALVAIVYMFMDWFGHYGDDGIFFWVFIRPFVSLIKGIIWPLVLMW
jgi:hypothetical protein